MRSVLNPPVKRHRETAEEIQARLIVAIDGPSGSGKSTTARAVARALGLRHVDTGAMYRALTHAALERGTPLTDGEALGALGESLQIEMAARDHGDVAVTVDGVDVSSSIRSGAVTKAVSEVSAHAPVRRAMVRRQRAAARGGGVVVEGRDIGTVVLPWADVRVYLDASPEVRASRRREQLRAAGQSMALGDIEEEQRRRDERDSQRKTSPLRRAIGAWPIDTSATSIEEQVDQVLRIASDTARRLADLYEQAPGQPSVWKRRVSFVLAQDLIWYVARFVFGLEVRNGLDKQLEESYLVAPNHISNVDPPVVGSTTRRELHFVAKSGLFKVGWFAKLLRSVNAFPIRRGIFDREAMSTALGLLQQGRSVMIFPEGGRVLGGELGKPRSGVGYLAIHSGVSVLPAYVTGSDQLRRCMFRRRRLIVVYGYPIRIPPALLEEYQAADDRDSYRLFTEMVMSAIGALRDDIGPC